MFWQQASFFVVIHSALATVVSQLLPKDKREPASLLVLSALGLVLALFWGYVARNRYWIIQQWHRQVRHLDRELDRYLVYEGVEVLLEKYWYRKPTWVTTLLPWLLAVGWAALLNHKHRLVNPPEFVTNTLEGLHSVSLRGCGRSSGWATVW
jgi:hypothetical protein